MPLGWIDFSKDERNKVLNVIHLLDEPGAVDEVGIGPFFPGNINSPDACKVLPYCSVCPYGGRKRQVWL